MSVCSHHVISLSGKGSGDSVSHRTRTVVTTVHPHNGSTHAKPHRRLHMIILWLKPPKLNEQIGVTRAQAAAMLAGSMFGWACPGADPANYDAQGQPVRKAKEVSQ